MSRGLIVYIGLIESLKQLTSSNCFDPFGDGLFGLDGTVCGVARPVLLYKEYDLEDRTYAWPTAHFLVIKLHCQSESVEVNTVWGETLHEGFCLL